MKAVDGEGRTRWLELQVGGDCRVAHEGENNSGEDVRWCIGGRQRWLWRWPLVAEVAGVGENMVRLQTYSGCSYSGEPPLVVTRVHGIYDGWGTDEKGIIEVIGHRNAVQRKLIKETYEQQYSEKLGHRFEKELSGDFERAVYRWMLEPFEREAVLANVALKKAEYKVIIELASTASAEELLAFKRAYQARYLHSLEEDVASHFTGDLRKLLLLLVSVHRYESEATNAKLAEEEAEILHNCIKDKDYKHDEIVRILTTRSKAQLVATFYRFRDAYGTPIAKSIAGDKDQDYVSALHTAIRCIKSPQKYLERVLSDAMHKRGTDEDTITRVIVTRAEKDLAKIKELFYKRNSEALEHAVAKETRGDYEKFLLTIMGAEHH